MDGLNERQRRFAEHYAMTEHGAGAIEAAGYKSRGASASVQANGLLKLPKVQAYIKAFQEKLRDERIMTAKEVLFHLSKLAESAAKDSDKIKALNLLARHHALLVDRVVVTEDETPLKTIREILGSD